MPDFDPMAVLRRLVDREMESAESLDDLRHELLAQYGGGEARRTGSSRLIRRVFVFVVASVAVGGGAVVGALWLSRSDPPESGPVCRTAAAAGADGFVLEPGADPLAGCEELWETGILPDPDSSLPPGQAVPPLTACVGPSTAIQVFPAGPEICAALGLDLAPASEVPMPDPVLELHERVVADVNAVGCVTTDVAIQRATEAINELQLQEWRVVVQPGAADAGCAKAAVDSSTKTVAISLIPSPP